jgi:hypothetical protein
MLQIPNDPTETFHKQIQQIEHRCFTLIPQNQHKHLIQMKPGAPQLNALIKIHKTDKPIRPVINSMTPSYKLAKHLHKKLSGNCTP